MAVGNITQCNKKNSYLLFFEKRDLEYSRLMPDVSDKMLDNSGLDEEFSSELRKGVASCVIQ